MCVVSRCVCVCPVCSGVLRIIGPAEMEAAEGAQGEAAEGAEAATYLQFEYECLTMCPAGDTAVGDTGSPTDICFSK